MNKIEIKNLFKRRELLDKTEMKDLLKRRESLLKEYKKLVDGYQNENNSEELNNIFRESANDVNYIICKIDDKLFKWVKKSHVGNWLLEIKGVTPDLAAGLLAHFNIKNKDCAAQFISYSGADSYTSHHNTDVKNIMNRLTSNFITNPGSLYGKLYKDKCTELKSSNDMNAITATIRADRYMRKVFISHLFEEMYREYHNGKLPERYNDDNRIIIEPEVPYTK